MSKIEVNTIEPISGSTTLTLGASGDTISIPAGVITSGFGKIGQIKFSTIETETSTTSTSFVDTTGYTVNITPSTTTSKIIVFAYGRTGVTGTQKEMQFQILRGSTVVQRGRDRYVGGGNAYGTKIFTFAIDSPSTTSQLTYKVQQKTEDATSQARVLTGSLTGLNVQGYMVAIEVLD